MLNVYYDAQTGIGLGKPMRDFAWQLAKRGFVTLSIGKPAVGINLDDPNNIPSRSRKYLGPEGRAIAVQPLSALAYAAANAHTVLANRPEVFPDRIGIVGHSFGGKWALFAACLYDKFACAVWSDPGIVFDERDRRKQNPGGSDFHQAKATASNHDPTVSLQVFPPAAKRPRGRRFCPQVKF